MEGFLLKQGERGPVKSFKKRWFTQKGTQLYYYKNKQDTTELGKINIAVALSCEKTESRDGRFHFRINTPKRIWHLLADTPEQGKYWVEGIERLIREQEFVHVQQFAGKVPRRSFRIETMENRIRDLEARHNLMHNALKIAANRLGVTVQELIDDAHEEAKAGSENQLANQNNQQALVNKIHTDSDLLLHNSPFSSPSGSVILSEEEESKQEKIENEEIKKEIPEKEKERKSADIPIGPSKEQPSAEPQNPKSAVPQPTQSNNQTQSQINNQTQPTNNQTQQQTEPPAGDANKRTSKKEDAKAFKAVVLYSYTAQQDYEMTISCNDIITVLSKHGNGWWLGQTKDGQQGYFPGSYVEPLKE